MIAWFLLQRLKLLYSFNWIYDYSYISLFFGYIVILLYMLCVFFHLNSYSTESIDMKDTDSYTLDLIRQILCNEKKFRVYIRIGNDHDEVLLPVIKTSIDDMRRNVAQQSEDLSNTQLTLSCSDGKVVATFNNLNTNHYAVCKGDPTCATCLK